MLKCHFPSAATGRRREGLKKAITTQRASSFRNLVLGLGRSVSSAIMTDATCMFAARWAVTRLVSETFEFADYAAVEQELRNSDTR